MQQLTVARQAEFQRYAKKKRREQFLEEMDAVMPWLELVTLVAPYYSTGETGRKPVGLEIMLRVYFLQQWFALSDPAAEDALYESAVRGLCGKNNSKKTRESADFRPCRKILGSGLRN